MRVFITNLGCKLNQAEMERAARRFVAAGHQIATRLEEADLHLVNSCTVTQAAARDSRKLARRGRRVNPAMRTVLTGCYASGPEADIARRIGVDLVVPNHEKDRLVQRVHESFPKARPRDGGGRLPIPYVPLEFGNARALVKAEDGCNMRCAFCIIPFTRGPQRSRPAAEVVDEAKRLSEGGFPEIVLTGVQISSYRWRQQGLFELTRRLLDETPLARLRLSSIAPWEFDLRLLDLFERDDGQRLCRHFHLSLQSGCDATLRRMRRPYSARQFAHLVRQIRLRVPGVAITTDLIVGFPGEDETEFDRSLATTRRLEFARIHAFPYSPRPRTAAAAMPSQVSAPTRKQRMARALGVARDAERAFWRRNLGTEPVVLWERRRGDRWLGTTDNYIPVAARGGRDLARRLAPARLDAMGDRSVAAVLAAS